MLSTFFGSYRTLLLLLSLLFFKHWIIRVEGQVCWAYIK
jgi:hypothetical protein